MARSITIEFLGKDKSAGSTAAKVEQKFGRFGGKLDAIGQKAGKVLAGGVLLGGAALTKFGERASTSNARIQNVAESMGLFGAMSDSVADRLIRTAEAQAKATGVDQNAIKETQAKLLTFKELADTAGEMGGAFDRATSAAVDMQAAGFGDASTNAVALGKALNDPIKGITALGRQGVTFSAKQQKVIKSLVETGKAGEAQEIILKAIETQVGGTAEATANSTDKMKVNMSLLAEQFGQALLPAVEKLSDGVADLTSWMSENQRTVTILVAAIGGLLATLYLISAAMRAYLLITKAWSAVTKVAAALQWAWNAAMAANPIGLVVLAIVGLIAILVLAYKKSETFRKIVDGAFNAVKAAAMGAWNWIKKNWPLLLAVITGPIGIAVLMVSRNWDRIKAGAGRVKDFIVQKFNDLIGFFRGLPSRVTSAVSGMWSGLGSGFRSVINGIIGGWNGLSFTIPSVSVFGKKIGGMTISTPNIPYLAKGGIVRARPGGTLVVAGEAGQDEAVVPLPRGARGVMGGTVIHAEFTGPVYGDPAAFGKYVETALLTWQRRSGRVLFG